MGLLIITIVLTILTLIGTIFTGRNLNKSWEENHNDRYTKEEDYRTTKKYFLWVLTTLLVPLLLLFGSFTSVGANEVGIVFDQLKGGVLEETYGQGIHTKSIFRKVTTIKTTNNVAEFQAYVQTKDSIDALYELTITYRIDKVDAGKFYRVTGAKELTSNNLNPVIKEILQKNSTQFAIREVMGAKLNDLRMLVEKELREELMTRYHVTLVAVSIDDVDAGDRIESSIREEQEAETRKKVAETERQTAKIKAEADAEKARIEAEAKKEIAIIEAEMNLTRAEAEAKVVEIKTKAEAEALELLNGVATRTINSMYNAQFETEQDKEDFENGGSVVSYLTIEKIAEIVVKQLYYDKWDGKLPNVITDGNGGIIIQP